MADQAQERWLTYAEVGELLGCTASAARARAQRHGWPRRGANAIGGCTKVLVPENLVQNVDGAAPVRRNTSGAYGAALVNGAAAPHGVALDPAHVAALVAPLEGAVAALATQLRAANEQLGIANRRIDELQQRIDGLYTDLADARTAAMISGCEAAVLRTRPEVLTERRPWWRRWFR